MPRFSLSAHPNILAKNQDGKFHRVKTTTGVQKFCTFLMLEKTKLVFASFFDSWSVHNYPSFFHVTQIAVSPLFYEIKKAKQTFLGSVSLNNLGF
jgi:hypothetical protein